MTRSKYIRKTVRPVRLYSLGGKSLEAAKSAFSGGNLGGSIGSLGSGIMGIAEAGMKNAQIADTSEMEAEIEQEQNTVVKSDNYDDLMNEWSAWSPREHISWRDIRGASGGEMAMNTISGVISGASSGASVGGPFGAIGGALAGLGSGIAGIFTGNKKARDKAKEINLQTDIANEHNLRAFSDKAENIDTQNDLNALSNFVAYGGPIERFDIGGDLDKVQATRKAARQLPGTPNEFLDNWNKARLATGRYDDQLGNGQIPQQKANRDSAPVFENPLTYGAMSYHRSAPVSKVNGESSEDTERKYFEEAARSAVATKKRLSKPTITGRTRIGEYNPRANTIYTNPDYPDNRTHEQAHASKAKPQVKKANEIVGKKYKDSYWDKGDEVYSRLMQLREANGIDPNQIWDKESLNEFKENAKDFNIMNRYDDDTVLDLFNNVAANNADNALIAAYGGDLNAFSKGGKIHIKPENRGKFTALKKRTGKSATWFKEHGTPAQKKMATFALNARKWKHEDGGPLFTHGGIWSNGITEINEGSTHEENPYEGVQIGVDSEGIPNLVEEGEVIFNDYVFSNRLTADKKLLEGFGLPKSYNKHSFADIAEKLSKESEERPNDPISQNGLESSMNRLRDVQEIVRQKKEEQEMNRRRYAYGGRRKLYGDGSSLGSPLTVPSFTANDPYGILGVSYPVSYPELEMPKSNRDSYIEDLGNMLAQDAATRSTPGEGDTEVPHYYDKTRYAPVLGSLMGALESTFSKPDYSGVERISAAANDAGQIRPVEYTPVSNYLQYKPFDRTFWINKQNAANAGARRAIMNSSSPSRYASLLAADYNAQNNMGDLYRKAEEYNQQQRQAVETFNRETNLANAQNALKASLANQAADQKAKAMRLEGIQGAEAMRDAIDQARSGARSANFSTLFNNIGNIGRENFNANMINSNPAYPYFIDLMGSALGYKGTNARGGYLTRNKRRTKKGGYHG